MLAYRNTNNPDRRSKFSLACCLACKLITAFMLFSASLMAATSALSASSYTLTNNSWSMISLPASSPSGNSAAQLFGNDLPIASYGNSGSWVIYNYDSLVSRYDVVPVNSQLKHGSGYWLFQKTGTDINISLPDDAQPFNALSSTACPDENGCIEVKLVANASGSAWNLVGYPQSGPQPLSATRVRTSSGVCTDGCTIAQAKANNIIEDKLFRFNGAHFEQVTPTTELDPWDALWLLVLPGAHEQSATWLLPALPPLT